MKLLIGNKNYSSWSMRPWLVLAHFGIDFGEEVLPLAGEGWRDVYADRTPASKVPVLEHGDLQIGESLAIIEYLADLFPDKAIWPQDMELRALARAASAEMHAGFMGLREFAPMNIRATMPERVDLTKVQKDLARLDILFGSMLAKSGGPFLCGEFSAVDAMFAPVAMRVVTYDLPVSGRIKSWIDALMENAAVKVWRASAMQETQIIPQGEIDMMDQTT